MDGGDCSFDDFESPDDLEIQVHPDDGNRTYPTCGADCSPERLDAGNGDGFMPRSPARRMVCTPRSIDLRGRSEMGVALSERQSDLPTSLPAS